MKLLDRTPLIAAALLAVTSISGCVATDTAPPTYQLAAPADSVKSAIVAVYSADGFTVYRDSQYQISMQRIRGGSALRHTYSITGSQPVVVTGNISVANNPGTGFERSSDFTWDGGAKSLMDGYMHMVRATVGQ